MRFGTSVFEGQPWIGASAGRNSVTVCVSSAADVPAWVCHRPTKGVGDAGGRGLPARGEDAGPGAAAGRAGLEARREFVCIIVTQVPITRNAIRIAQPAAPALVFFFGWTSWTFEAPATRSRPQCLQTTAAA